MTPENRSGQFPTNNQPSAEKKQKDVAREKLEQLSKRLAEKKGGGIFLYDRDGNFFTINQVNGEISFFLTVPTFKYVGLDSFFNTIPISGIFSPCSLEDSFLFCDVRHRNEAGVLLHLRYDSNGKLDPNFEHKHTFSFTNVTEASKERLREIPYKEQIPPIINFPAEVVKICDVVFEIIENRQLTPERIAKLREVIYGQATRD